MWIPSEILELIRDINIEPYDIHRKVIEIEAEIDIRDIFSREVRPATLMITQGEVRWQGSFA